MASVYPSYTRHPSGNNTHFSWRKTLFLTPAPDECDSSSADSTQWQLCLLWPFQGLRGVHSEAKSDFLGWETL